MDQFNTDSMARSITDGINISDIDKQIDALSPIMLDLVDPESDAIVRGSIHGEKHFLPTSPYPVDRATGRVKEKFQIDLNRMHKASITRLKGPASDGIADADKKSSIYARIVPPNEFWRVMSLPESERDVIINEQTKDLEWTDVAVQLPAIKEIRPGYITHVFYDFTGKEVDRRYVRLTSKTLDEPNRHIVTVKDLANQESDVDKKAGALPSDGHAKREGHHIEIVSTPSQPSQEPSHDDAYGEANAFNGGQLNRGYPYLLNGKEVDYSSYVKHVDGSIDSASSTTIHESQHVLSRTPYEISYMIPEEYSEIPIDKLTDSQIEVLSISVADGLDPFNHVSTLPEIINLLQSVNNFTKKIIGRKLRNSKDLHEVYSIIWKPNDNSQEADEYRSKIPFEVRRFFDLYHHLNIESQDSYDDKTKRDEFHDFLDNNNVLPQVNYLHQSVQDDHSSRV